MKCEDFELLMADALGDELAPQDRSAFEAHIAECECCRFEYEAGRRALDAMRSLPGPCRVTVERRGSTLILHDPVRAAGAAGGLRARRWLTGGAFRYAASILLAFAAGYALHTGLMIAEVGRSDVTVARRDGAPGETLVGATSDSAVPASTDSGTVVESFHKALVAAHERKPGRTNLAKCMIAMFPSEG